MRSFLSTLFGIFSDLFLVSRFVLNPGGKEYGVGRLRKANLALKIRMNSQKVQSLSPWQQHILMADEILRVPKSREGVVVECGCFCGSSTISLSLACALTGRSLIVCDSFEGLPKPKEHEELDVRADFPDYFLWEEGEFSSEGGMDGVRRNVEKYGRIRVCQFVKGYFCDSLPSLEADSVVLVFEDADLRSSTEDCLINLWPKLQDGCKFYCHEPWSTSVVGIFFDKVWWEKKLGANPPGFYGSGKGLVAGLQYTHIGYAHKFDAESKLKTGNKIMHAGSTGFSG